MRSSADLTLHLRCTRLTRRLSESTSEPEVQVSAQLTVRSAASRRREPVRAEEPGGSFGGASDVGGEERGLGNVGLGA